MSQGFDKNTFKFSNIANINSSAWTGANASLGAIIGGWFVMYSKVGLWTDNSNSAGSGYHSCACLTIYPSGWKSRLRLTIAKASAGDTNRNQACDKLFKMYGGTTGDKIDIDYDVEGKNMVF